MTGNNYVGFQPIVCADSSLPGLWGDSPLARGLLLRSLIGERLNATRKSNKGRGDPLGQVLVGKC